MHPHLHRELWRLRNQKGWAGHLVGVAAEWVLAQDGERGVGGFGERLLQ